MLSCYKRVFFLIISIRGHPNRVSVRYISVGVVSMIIACWLFIYSFIQFLFINAKTSLLNINVFICKVICRARLNIFPAVLSKNVAHF